MRRGVTATLLVAGTLIAGALLCTIARADEAKPIRFRQHLPMYIATDYSTSDDWEKANTPYLKAQASMAASILRAPVTVGPITFDPELAFTWRANQWPVGAESSPITENIYQPEVFIRFNEDERGYFRGARVGWLHASSGTDSNSASLDRVLMEGKFAHDLIIGTHFLYLTGYGQLWFVAEAGMETDDIKKYIDFAKRAIAGDLEDWGGQVILTAEVPGIVRAVAELGLSYQHYELYIPLADAYDINLFGQLHNGYANGIMDYAESATSGGVGIALLR